MNTPVMPLSHLDLGEPNPFFLPPLVSQCTSPFSQPTTPRFPRNTSQTPSFLSPTKRPNSSPSHSPPRHKRFHSLSATAGDTSSTIGVENLIFNRKELPPPRANAVKINSRITQTPSGN